MTSPDPEPVYLHLPVGDPPPDWPVAPFLAVVLITQVVDVDWQKHVSEWLVRTGCLFMMAWGLDCSSWDDSVDYANLDAFAYGNIPDEAFVFTTWHDDEPLEDVFWFAAHGAYHSHVALERIVIVDIAPNDRREFVLTAYHRACTE